MLTDEQKRIALDLAVEGKGIQEIRAALGIDTSTFWKYRDKDPLFATEFARARQEGMEELADNLLTIVDTYTDVQKARVHSENVRWLLSKRKPATYGDRLDVNVNNTTDIVGALNEAKRRALPMRYQQPIEDAQVVEPLTLTHDKNTDSESETTEPDIFS